MKLSRTRSMSFQFPQPIRQLQAVKSSRPQNPPHLRQSTQNKKSAKQCGLFLENSYTTHSIDMRSAHLRLSQILSHSILEPLL
jgi:hypothetical protein